MAVLRVRPVPAFRQTKDLVLKDNPFDRLAIEPSGANRRAVGRVVSEGRASKDA
jgi:hypothetical protein